MHMALVAFGPLLSSASWPQGGVADCPCIDPFAHGIVLNNNTPRAVVAGCDLERSADRLCYSASYGSTGCAAHDTGIDPLCANST